MEQKRALIVYYSGGGATEQLAREIARFTCFDVDPIVHLGPRPREGVRGLVRSYVETFSRYRPPITTTKDPAEYDLVVVGSPVWGGSMASPVRSYLEQRGHEFRRVALFCTTRSRGAWETLREMASLCDARPEAMLFATHTEIEARRHRDGMLRFVDALRPSAARAAA